MKFFAAFVAAIAAVQLTNIRLLPDAECAMYKAKGGKLWAKVLKKGYCEDGATPHADGFEQYVDPTTAQPTPVPFHDGKTNVDI